MADDTPRKTLTLKKPAQKSAKQADHAQKSAGYPAREVPRARSGARAKKVAQAQLTRQIVSDTPSSRDQQNKPRTTKPTPRSQLRSQQDIAVRRTSTNHSGNTVILTRPAFSATQSDHANTLRAPALRGTRLPHRGPAADGNAGKAHLLADVTAQQRFEALAPQPDTLYSVFAPCPQGLEQALAQELTRLGFADVNPSRAGCHFKADWTDVMRANLQSRLATRILVQVAKAPVQKEDDILELARATPWEQWFGPRHTLRVDTSAIRSPMQSLQYCNLRAKDGICDRLREREGERPSIDTVRPDARVHLFLDERSATLYLDTSGESLFKRGWRLDKGQAPLRENLASGLLALSGWQPGQALLDPFCGSGTILIEAAGIALGAPPGIWRPFAFERLRNHDDQRWHDLKDEARAKIATSLEAPLLGADIDANAIEAARANAKRAWLSPDVITFRSANALDVLPPADSGWIVTNPPYGERLEDADIAFWRQWSEHLKRHYAQWHVGAISSDLELPRHLRLKPRQRIPLHNGALDCRLFLFDIVASGYRT